MNRLVPRERTVSLMEPTQDPLLLLVVSSRRQLKAVPQGMIYSSGSDLRLVLIQLTPSEDMLVFTRRLGATAHYGHPTLSLGL